MITFEAWKVMIPLMLLVTLHAVTLLGREDEGQSILRAESYFN